uniref:Receptor ligand binding region domain-containing protein n=1 Tax=Timema cristinae TaxID=61476 RepID=A0A7R9D675_TIMCR|nr:unnamed protein product [Timema cristinae]
MPLAAGYHGNGLGGLVIYSAPRGYLTVKLKGQRSSKMDAKLVTTLCVVLVTSLLNAESHQNPTYFNIGGVLSNNDSEFHFQEIIAHLNFANQYVPKGVTYYATAIQMDANPIRTALNVCKYLIAQRVYAVVVSHPLIGDLSPAAVSYTSGFYHIPVIGISSRDSAFSDKLESTIEFEPGLDTFTERLYESTHSAQSRVYLMYASKTDSEVIFRDAGLLNMTGASNVWIVTEQALEANNVPEGTLGLKLVNATDETAHIQDSIYVLASALKAMNQTETITEAPNDCNSSGTIWETGKKLFEYV